MKTDTEVRVIDYHDTKPFLLNIHYARKMPCIQYAFGLFRNDRLIGCVTYGQPASAPLCKGIAGEENRRNVLELNRLVITESKKNDASFLVSHSLRMLPRYTFVVSYADIEGWGHVGKVYQACHFLYTGKTKSRTDKFSESGHSRHYKEGETARQYRTSKYRYIYLVGTRADKRKMLTELRYPVLPEYPQEATKKYDTSNPIPLRSKEL